MENAYIFILQLQMFTQLTLLIFTADLNKMCTLKGYFNSTQSLQTQENNIDVRIPHIYFGIIRNHSLTKVIFPA